MFEVEGEVARLDIDLPGSDEDRLEPDSLGPNIAVRPRLCAFADRANGGKIVSRESILIAFDNDSIGVNIERDKRQSSICPGPRETIVVGVLQQLEDKTSITAVDILGETSSNCDELARDDSDLRRRGPYVLIECAASVSLANMLSSIRRRISGLQASISAIMSSPTNPNFLEIFKTSAFA